MSDQSVNISVTVNAEDLHLDQKNPLNHIDFSDNMPNDGFDNPNDKSVKYLVDEHQLFNPMETILNYDKGSQNHNYQWNLFDQIFFTTNFFEIKDETFRFDEADIFDEKLLTQFNGKYKGQPFRTYVGKKYKGGFSDHFPVYIILKKE